MRRLVIAKKSKNKNLMFITSLFVVIGGKSVIANFNKKYGRDA